MDILKQRILDGLATWIYQRPGLEYVNYGDPVTYRAEVRRVGRQLQDARILLRAVELADSITAADILASTRAYSGRLSIKVGGTDEAPTVVIDYCTGQYWPTEYRAAACAVLSAALWGYKRDRGMPAPVLKHNSETGETRKTYQDMSAGTYMRRSFAREFGRGMAARWFD